MEVLPNKNNVIYNPGFWEPTEEDNKREFAQALMEIREKRRSKQIWDPISGEKMQLYDWELKYKTKKYSKYLYDYSVKDKQIPKEIYAEIKRLPDANQKKKKSQSNRNSRVECKKPKKSAMVNSDAQNKQYFAKVDARISENMKTSKCHRNPTGLLITLLKHRAWKGKKDKHKTWDYWYQKEKKIVASVGIKKLMDEIGTSRSSINRYRKKLEKNGDIMVELERRENVYVLGYVDHKGKEVFYYTQPKNNGCQI